MADTEFKIDRGSLTNKLVDYIELDPKTNESTATSFFVITGKSKDGIDFSAKGNLKDSDENYQKITEITVGSEKFKITTSDESPSYLMLDKERYNQKKIEPFVTYLETLINGGNVLQHDFKAGIIKLTPTTEPIRIEDLRKFATLNETSVSNHASLPRIAPKQTGRA